MFDMQLVEDAENEHAEQERIRAEGLKSPSREGQRSGSPRPNFSGSQRSSQSPVRQPTNSLPSFISDAQDKWRSMSGLGAITQTGPKRFVAPAAAGLIFGAVVGGGVIYAERKLRKDDKPNRVDWQGGLAVAIAALIGALVMIVLRRFQELRAAAAALSAGSALTTT